MKMKVILAGHNIDHEIIEEFQNVQPERQELTPETVAAAYARISRNPKPVNELGGSPGARWKRPAPQTGTSSSRWGTAPSPNTPSSISTC